jgi:uncharacterized damage-inducible protein DinB
MKPLFEMYAAYNAWVNERLYDAAARIPDAEYRRDRGAFFGSLHGTLNHLLVGDRIWMHRFAGEGEEPRELDGILYEKFSELRAERRAEDARISRYIAGLSDQALVGTLSYRSTRSPAELEQHLAPLLLHFFNHQTHHRGQAHCLITEITGEAPSFDLLVYQRQTGAGMIKGQGGDFSKPEKRPR